MESRHTHRSRDAHVQLSVTFFRIPDLSLDCVAIRDVAAEHLRGEGIQQRQKKEVAWFVSSRSNAGCLHANNGQLGAIF